MAALEGKPALLRSVYSCLVCGCMWPTFARMCWYSHPTCCQGLRRNLRIRQQFHVVVEKWQTTRKLVSS
eukprot:8920430-Karenia_brevis.AAC.1